MVPCRGHVRKGPVGQKLRRRTEQRMVNAKLQPQTLSGMRAKCRNDVLSSVTTCILAAALFWAIGFGTDASPSIPRFLVTVTMPAFVFGDYIRYRLATGKLDFTRQPSTRRSAA